MDAVRPGRKKCVVPLLVLAMATGGLMAGDSWPGAEPGDAAYAAAGPGKAGHPGDRRHTGKPPRGTSYTPPRTRTDARVGALFQHSDEGDHFCTGSVVDSPGRDLVLTAAHCVHGGADGDYLDDLVFVPDYRDGSAPNGTWQVDDIYVDERWKESSDPDLDVAFLRIKPRDGRLIEDVLGGNTLGIGRDPARPVKITGYPADRDEPLSCKNRTSAFGATQLRIQCADLSGGTSGSPWITSFDPRSREGTVIGITGGYEGGGDTDDVSYSPYFGEAVRRLYERAAHPAAEAAPDS
ncbi:trypsin-like serine peptidase [Streptomyces sp. URMC 123]|uniref:trypsin-like serine peptidase n=1 Tax=Streptomyces sp. URMC 123 TaxID=3423403 RepID=UPI003F1D687F